MRRRILRSLVGVAIASVVMLGIPLGVAGTIALRLHAREQREHVAETVLAAIASDLEAGREVGEARLRSLLPTGFGAELVDGTGPAVRAGPGGPIDTTSDARANLLVLRVWRVDDPTTRQIRMLWFEVGGLALVVLSAAIALATVLARRLSRPLHALAGTASRLGAGDLSARAAGSDVPEIDRIATALNGASQRIGEALVRERQFSSNVAHQLRTPITGLLLQLDSADVDDRAAVQGTLSGAVDQATRLSAIIDDLLHVGRTARAAADGGRDRIRLDALARRHVLRWTGRAAPLGRRLELCELGAPLVTARPGVVEQVLDVLLDNAIVHGRGDITVAVEVHAASGCLLVRDEGAIADDTPAKMFERGWSSSGRSGIGLGLGRTLVEATDGRLELVSTEPTTFALYLPLAREGRPAPVLT